MRKKLVAAGTAMVFGLAGCTGEEPARPSVSITEAPATQEPLTDPSSPRVHCTEHEIGTVVLSPGDQQRVVGGNVAVRTLVRNALNPGNVALSRIGVTTHSPEELRVNAAHNTSTVEAIARLISTAPNKLAGNADYLVTREPNVIRPDYIGVTTSLQVCHTAPDPMQPQGRNVLV